MKRRFFIATSFGSLAALFGAGCEHKCCDGSEHGRAAPSEAPTGADDSARAAIATIPPGTSVDPAFEACGASCGSKPPSDAVVRVQPGAAEGEWTYCPVSGATFEVGSRSHWKRLGDDKLYFCCESCAGYFAEHTQKVLARRGIQSPS